MNRCRQCDAPLTINGTHCNRCGIGRDDMLEQEQQARRRDPIVTFLSWVLGSFFSLTFLVWFAACAAVGACVGSGLYYGLDWNGILCWIVAAIVTLFLYGLSWIMVIFHD